MKNTPLTICKKAGCNCYTRNSNNLCDKHQISDRRGKWSFNAEAKKLYNSKLWQRTREYKLQQNPTCEICSSEAHPVPADQVHHIDHNPQNNHPDNIMSTCDRCHRYIHKTDEAPLTRKALIDFCRQNLSQGIGGSKV